MVLVICSGFQMLGRNIHDPTSIESAIGSSQALGYLPINTRLQIEKQLIHSTGKLMLQANVHDNDIEVTALGYQIHVGHIERKDDLNTFALLNDAQQSDTKLNDAQLDGSVSADNQVAGSYLHSMFDSPDALQHIIAWAGANIDEAETYARQQEHELDPLADACMAHIMAENTRIYH
jgi:adenosylcobyric acid synthase